MATPIVVTDETFNQEVLKSDTPTLLVYGNKDTFVTPLTNDDLRELDGNVRPIGLADSGHFPMLDEANKFQRLLRDFLDTKTEDLGALALKDEWRRRMH